MHKKNYILATILLACSAHALALTAVSVGTVNLDPKNRYATVGMELYRDPNTSTWGYSSALNNLPDSKGFKINKVSCWGTNCVMVGRIYVGHYGEFHPFTANSTDRGMTWNYQDNYNGVPEKHKIPAKYLDLQEVHCYQNFCLTTGDYIEGVMFTSNNYGYTWNYLDANALGTYVNKFTCNDSVCVGVGSFLNTVIAVTRDHGTSWEKKENIGNLPCQLKWGALGAANCNGNTCVVGGSYYDGHNDRFALISSYDNANTWSYVSNIENLSKDITGGKINSVNCNAKACVAVGHQAVGGVIKSLLLVGDNATQSWRAIDIPQIANANSAALYGVNCSATYCITVGSYSDGKVNFPLILTTRDDGKTWSMVKDVKNFPYTNFRFNINNADLRSISCVQDYCYAAGKFTSGADRGLIMETNDAGQTWSLVTSIYSLKNIWSVWPNQLNSISSSQ